MNSTDLQELCTTNASVAAQAGRMDLVQAWSTAMLIADTSLRSPLEANSQVPWPEHPFGRRLIHSLYVMCEGEEFICVYVGTFNFNGVAKRYMVYSLHFCTLACSINADCRDGKLNVLFIYTYTVLCFNRSLSSLLRFNHFAKLHDIQTLAMLACLFLEHCAQFDNTTRMTLQSKKPAVVKVPIAHIKAHNGNHNSMYKSLPPTRVSPTYRVHTQVSGRVPSM